MRDNPVINKALPVLSRLNEAGYKAYFVGGCVRDLLLGRKISDVDIATSAEPAEVQSLFPHSIPTGLQHGTVTVIMDGRHYEITTFRRESEYEKHRRPAKVDFIRDLEGDLQRRDFTVNAMAMAADGTITDPYGGMEDLRKSVIRCVGDGDMRFREDALRMLRAIRFASEFQYTISKSTWAALLRHRNLLAHIAMERIGMELDKMIGGSGPGRALCYLRRSGILGYTRCPDIGLSNLTRLQEIGIPFETLPDKDLRWAALLFRTFRAPEEARKAMAGLGYAGTRIRRIVSVTAFQVDVEKALADPELQQNFNEAMHVWWTRLVIHFGKETAEDWLTIALRCKVEPASGIAVDRLSPASGWLTSMPVFNLKELKMTGEDLMAVARRGPGVWIKEELDHLLLLCASGKIPNDKDALLSEAKGRLEKEQP